jgi:hypothetical protein
MLMEIANLVPLCHGQASCQKLMQVVRKPKTGGKKIMKLSLLQGLSVID